MPHCIPSIKMWHGVHESLRSSMQVLLYCYNSLLHSRVGSREPLILFYRNKDTIRLIIHILCFSLHMYMLAVHCYTVQVVLVLLQPSNILKLASTFVPALTLNVSLHDCNGYSCFFEQ